MSRERLIKICRRTVEFCLLASVFLTPLIVDFSRSSYNLFELYRSAALRALLAAALLAAVAEVFLSGKISWRGRGAIFPLALGLAASFGLSSLMSLHPNQSFWGSFLRQQGFYSFFNYVLFFVLLAVYLRERRQAKRLVIAAAAAAGLAGLYGLVQFFGLDPVPWALPSLDRIFSTLGQPNFFGHFLILTLPLALYVLLFLCRGFYFRLLAAAAVLLELFCLVFTYSRAAWLGFFGSMFFLVLAWLLLRGSKRLAIGLAGLAFAGLAAVVAFNFSFSAAGGNPDRLDPLYRLESLLKFNNGSNRMRLYYLKAGLKEFKQEPVLRRLFGYGPETLAGVFIKYYRPDWGVYEAVNTLPDRAHNWVLDQFLSLGLIGLAATLAFYGYFLYRVLRHFRGREKLDPDDWLLVFSLAGLTAYFINNLFSFSLTANSLYLFLLLGLAWFSLNRNEPVKQIYVRLTAASKIIIWLALAATAGVFFYAADINWVRAELEYVNALKALKAGDCRAVSDNLEAVLKFNPYNAYYRENYLYLNLNCLVKLTDQAERLKLAERLSTQIDLTGDKNFYGFLANQARAYTLFGLYFDPSYYGRAEKIFNDLISAYPYFTTAYQDLGKQKMLTGDYAAARRLFERALKILPLNHPDLNAEHRGQIEAAAVELYEQAGQAALRGGDYPAATDYFRAGLKLDPYRATLYKNLADVYYLKADLNQAIKFNQRGYQLNPADYHWPLSLSLLYRDSHDLAEAREYLAQALKLKPENEELKQYERELNK